jgi:hypothetical protein
MIVPDHWAEARRQHKASGRQVTVRRFGWSTSTPSDALAMAEARAEEALRRIVAGERLGRREPKVPYNGASGVPIREEVLARHGEQVITRNSYGARCLNSPNALFADIDFALEHTPKAALLAVAVLAAASIVVGVWSRSWGLGLALLLVSLFAASPLAKAVLRLTAAAHGGPERMARERLTAFLTRNPSWSVRLYRTPLGYRVLATHQPFDSDASEVRQFFAAVSADPIYVRMCENQRCFRARLSAKPWRIGIAAHMRPRPGVWPVRPERLGARNEWVAAYEAKAAAYAACRYIETLGSGVVHEAIRTVVELHDRESRAQHATAVLA